MINNFKESWMCPLTNSKPFFKYHHIKPVKKDWLKQTQKAINKESVRGKTQMNEEYVCERRESSTPRRTEDSGERGREGTRGNQNDVLFSELT